MISLKSATEIARELDHNVQQVSEPLGMWAAAPKPATRLPLIEMSSEHVEKSLRVPTYLRNRPFGS
jgi:hypothetical protein